MKPSDKLLKKYHQYRENGGMLIYSEWKRQYHTDDPASTSIRRIVIALVIAAILFLLVFNSKGQAQCYRNPGTVSLGIGAGYSTENSFAVDLRVKITSNRYFLQFGYGANTTAMIKAGSVFYAGAGYDICLSETVSLSPMIGYQFTLRSTDKQDLNTMGYAAGVSVTKYLWDGGSVYVSALNTREQTISSIGFIASF